MTSHLIQRGPLSADIRAISSQIRALKRALRAPWQRPMQPEQRQLELHKLRATELCALAAFSRGRLHLTRPPHGAASDWDALTYHRRVLERLGPSYVLTLEQSA